MDQARDAHARAADMSVAQRRPPLWLLIAITAIAPFALNVFVPSMPGLAAQFGAGPDEAQLTLTFFLVGVAVGQLACGPVSDRLGRRPVLLAGLALFTAATLLCLLAPTLPLLIAGRLLQALGACAGLVLGRAIVRDTVDPAHVAGALGILNGVMAAAPAIAPAIGGFLDTWQGWRASFLVLLALGAILLAL
ncbi:MAG: MFS transporter, partial [Alphaproteobacteria bacterium]|nr:MFS transporter [Alphaproteobacteria bacterium]